MDWIDTHCHLDAAEFDADRAQVIERARAAGVGMLVLPAVAPGNFDAVRAMAHAHGFAYALGVHPLYVADAPDDALDLLAQRLHEWRDDPRLVAVGEIGVDLFEPAAVAQRARQERFYRAQLKLAQRHGLPVLLHVRRAVDPVLAGLRRIEVPGGIAHAFNGSPPQAAECVARGLCLGFGGTLSFEAARRIRRLAAEVPDVAPVLETDAPDIPPQWCYRTAAQRAEPGQGHQGRNEPCELPRIAQVLADLRGLSAADLSRLTTRNARAVLPRLAALIDAAG